MDNTTEQLKQALELDRDGDWDTAHGIVQRFSTPDACWTHAYLHREEGDMWNSGYWYRRANKTMPTYALEQEWSELYDHIAAKLGS